MRILKSDLLSGYINLEYVLVVTSVVYRESVAVSWPPTASCKLHIAFKEEPLERSIFFIEGEEYRILKVDSPYVDNIEVALDDGTWVMGRSAFDYSKSLGVIRLQKRVDEFVKEWQTYLEGLKA